MATFTAYDQNHQPIANFDYGIVCLINAMLNREYKGEPMSLDAKELPAIKSLKDLIERGFNTAEILKDSWSYQIKPGEKHFQMPISIIINHLESKKTPLMLLED